MLYAFIDESYTADRYYVSAFVVPVESLNALDVAIRRAGDYAQSFGIPAGAEFHAHEMMAGKGEWKALRGRHRAAIAIYQHVLDNLIELPAKVFVRGVDINRLNARYQYPHPPHRIALQHLLERLDGYASSVGERVTIIADEVQGQDEHAARAERYQIGGTGGYKSSTLPTIEMPMIFGSSSQSPGLQASDLVVYLYRRLDAHVETDHRARAAVRMLWGTLEPIYAHAWRWDP